MRVSSYIKDKIVIFFSICVLVIILYWGAWNAFFQQDEWAGLGNFYALAGDNHLEKILSLYSHVLHAGWGHFLLLTPIVNYTRYSIFGLEYPLYLILSLLLHICSSFLVYILSFRLTQKKFASYIATLLFITCASISQAVSWVGTSVPTQLAAIFSLLTIIYWIEWLNKSNKIAFIVSLFSLLLAINSKETALFLLPALPFIGFIYKPIRTKTYLKLFSGIILIYFCVRLLLLITSRKGVSQVLSVVPDLINNFLNVFLYSTAQIIVPQKVWEWILDRQFLEPLSSELLLRILYLILSAIFLIVSLLFWKKQKDKSLLIGIAITFFSYLPLTLLSPTELSAVFLPSRNFYLPAIGVFLCFGIILERIFLSRRITVKVIFYTVLGVILLSQVYSLYLTNVELVTTGITRKSILNKITDLHPALPKKAIIFIESDKSYYGLPPGKRIMPFQSGFGQTLLVWYYPQSSFSRQLFENNFLWGITDQGYKEVGESGFGYYYDFDNLATFVKDKSFDTKNIISFRYDSNCSCVVDSSDEIRGRLTGYLTQKVEIPKVLYNIESSLNQSTLKNINDNDRNSFWRSNLPYSQPQYLIVKLPTSKKISEIIIDSNDNKDQNEVGYKISISNDGETWKDVFYAKRYTPDEKGLVYLYFNPETTKLVRINQTGYHQFADWVIHEIYLYESIN